MITNIEKVPTETKRTSKLGVEHTVKRFRTIYHIQCDICGRNLTRSKGEAYKIEERDKHFCSPECSAKNSFGPESDFRQKQKIETLRPKRYKSGYIYVGKKREHQLVVEADRGRPLEKHELVHHINGDKGDNRLENLTVCQNTQHHNRIHGQLEGLSMLLVQKGIIKFCKTCRLYYLKK